jgi:hypothetical protein
MLPDVVMVLVWHPGEHIDGRTIKLPTLCNKITTPARIRDLKWFDLTWNGNVAANRVCSIMQSRTQCSNSSQSITTVVCVLPGLFRPYG